MEEKKEIRKRIFKARKEHDDAWIQEKSHVITEDTDETSGIQKRRADHGICRLQS